MTFRAEEAFSREEVLFLKQSGLFSWKEILTQRIKRALEDLHAALAPRVVPEALLAPPETDFARWQLVRGERFHERPYVYLDFPQCFSRAAKFTYRSLFWWGEGLFFAMILDGPMLDQYWSNLDRRYAAVADQDLVLSLAETPWEWRQAGPAVLPIRSDTRSAVADAARRARFLKLQRAMDLDRLIEPGAIVREGVETFERFLPVLTKTGF